MEYGISDFRDLAVPDSGKLQGLVFQGRAELKVIRVEKIYKLPSYRIIPIECAALHIF